MKPAAWLLLAVFLLHCDTARSEPGADPAKAAAATPSGPAKPSPGTAPAAQAPAPATAAAPAAEDPDLPGSRGSHPPSTWKTAPSHLLVDEIEKVYKAQRVRGRLGVSVYSVKHGRFEASINDDQFFTPASCLKLLVTAAALDTFPVNTFPTTTMDTRGALQGRVFQGRLRVAGGGDPNISDRFFPDALTPLYPFVDSLKALGVDTVRGILEVDDSYFSGPRRPEAWLQHHYNTWYGAEVSALSYNDNCFTLSVLPASKPGAPAVVSVKPDVGYVKVVNRARTVSGGKRRIVPIQNPDSTIITLGGQIGTKARGVAMVLPVRNPPAYFRASLLKAMELRGLVFVDDAASAASGKALAESDPSKAVDHAFRFTTSPLINVVEEINQRSQNLHAELTLRHLGRLVKGEGSAEAGLRAEREFLARMGVDSADFKLHDGCGLSRDNRLKPRALALLLAKMARHRYVEDYIASLASPGLDGATGSRLRPYMQKGLIRYKTGSINQVQGLSGYAFGIDGDTLAVSLFVNEFRGSSDAAARLLDSLFIRVAHWYNKERDALIDAHKLLSRKDLPKDYLARLRHFSAALQDRPYFLGPTGEGRYGLIDPKPLADLSRFDCVTYIESAMALAASRHARDLLPRLLPIRYGGDAIAFNTRNHFFVEDWIRNNSGRVRVARFPGDSLMRKPMDKIAFYKGRQAAAGRDSAILRQLPVPAANPVTEFAFLPYAKAVDMMAHWTHGEKFLGVAFVTDIPGLDVTHTGFLLADGKGPPRLRHASQLGGKVLTQDFKEYLDSRKGKCAGVLFFEFLAPTTLTAR
jgi:D-alanyl-D-alanine carboxypeptidase/D-alanyl-D-alanine-endopeptidase (penicillin-binding protein 4)